MTQKPAAGFHNRAMDLEHRAMDLTRWANLGMGLVGALAAWASNSYALLMGGLFSLVGYVSAVYAMRISLKAHRGPDHRRPFGHAADEALYATFRSLALLGLVLFGIGQSVLGITDYLLGGEVEVIRRAPVAAYTLVVVIACFWLAHVHYSAWKRTGQLSEMLKLEATASVYDGFIALFAGVGLLAAPLLIDTKLGFAAPIMDSVMVFILCAFPILSYLKSLRKGVAQLAGHSAADEDQRAVLQSLERVANPFGGRIHDVALVRMGRKLDAVVYYDPLKSVTAEELDNLALKMNRQLSRDVGPAGVIVVMSELGRGD